MKKIILLAVLAGNLTLCGFCFASSTPAEEATEKASEAIEQKLQEITLKGIIEQSEEGTALVGNEGTFALTGGDFTEFIGKEVAVTGTVIQEGDASKLIVSNLALAK